MNYLSRIFLNKKIGMAAMQAEFNVMGSYVDCSLVMSDCGRQITIDLSSHSAKVFNERQIKLDSIIKELTTLRDKLAEYKASDSFKKGF